MLLASKQGVKASKKKLLVASQEKITSKSMTKITFISALDKLDNLKTTFGFEEIIRSLMKEAGIATAEQFHDMKQEDKLKLLNELKGQTAATVERQMQKIFKNKLKHLSSLGEEKKRKRRRKVSKPEDKKSLVLSRNHSLSRVVLPRDEST